MLEGPKPPEEFGVVGEDLHTDYACPRCGYRWSGRADAGAERGGAPSEPAWPLSKPEAAAGAIAGASAAPAAQAAETAAPRRRRRGEAWRRG
jgi:hypothetical protein